AIVLYNAFTGLESIQNATNQTQQELESAIQRNRVTPSPTAIFSAGNYLLPGGHTPPDENGIAQFNVGEVESLVPVSLRPAVMQELYAPVSLVQQDLPNNPIAVDIPAIGL